MHGPPNDNRQRLRSVGQFPPYVKLHIILLYTIVYLPPAQS